MLMVADALRKEGPSGPAVTARHRVWGLDTVLLHALATRTRTAIVSFRSRGRRVAPRQRGPLVWLSARRVLGGRVGTPVPAVIIANVCKRCCGFTPQR